MKSTYYTIPASGLNTEVQQIDVSINVGSYVVDGENINDSDTYFPAEIKINNTSGSKLGFVTISNDKELQLMAQKPELFAFIPIPNGFYTVNNFVEKTKYILIKRLDSIQVLKDISMYCIGYRK